MNLSATLLARASDPGRTAVRELSRSLSYAELASRVVHFGGALRELGVAAGDRVVVLLPDTIEAVVSILGAIHIGAIAVPLAEWSTALDIRAHVQDAKAVVAVVGGKTGSLLDQVRQEVPSLAHVIAVGAARPDQHAFDDLLERAPAAGVHDSTAQDPALIVYTENGKDGPKGVVHSHATPLRSYEAYAHKILALTGDDRVFSTTKLASAYGLGAGLVFPLAAGAQTLLLPGQPRTSVVSQLMDALEPTVLFATPSQYGQILADATAQRGATRLGKLRACVSGMEALPAALAARMTARFGVEVLSGYGLSESFHFVIANRPDRRKLGSSGVVLDGFQARVVDDQERPVPDGDIGALQVRGPSIGLGYFHRPAETARVFRDKWLHTGDRCFVDPQGFYVHCGREDDLFKVSGKWVSPVEIERTLLAHAAVWECAVVGAEDENGLTKPLAFVVPNVDREPGPDLEHQLMAFVKKEIAPYKYPRWIEFVNELPKGANGNLLRYKLLKKVRRRSADSDAR